MNTLTIAGETRTVAEWARVAGLCYNTLYYRLRNGVEPRDAVFLPLGTKKRPRPRSGYIKPKKRHRVPVRFPVTVLRWGSVQSVTFGRAA